MRNKKTKHVWIKKLVTANEYFLVEVAANADPGKIMDAFIESEIPYIVEPTEVRTEEGAFEIEDNPPKEKELKNYKKYKLNLVEQTK
jgi:hypothetical protein